MWYGSFLFRRETPTGTQVRVVEFVSTGTDHPDKIRADHRASVWYAELLADGYHELNYSIAEVPPADARRHAELLLDCQCAVWWWMLGVAFLILTGVAVLR